MNHTRIESDSMGQVRVASDKLWGAQTQRSLEHFQIGREQFVWSASVIRALGWVKKSAVLSNQTLGQIPAEIADAVVTACDEVIAGQLDAHFPLVIFQTGSGTQTKVNSSTKCNAVKKHGRRNKAKPFARSIVQFVHNCIQEIRIDVRHRSLFGNVLANKTIGVFI